MSMFSDATDFLFGSNPADSAKGYYNQVANTIKPYYQPYIDSGNLNMGWHDTATQQMLTNPMGIYNTMASGYTQSPGYEYNLQQSMNAAKNIGATSGQAGSPAMQQWMMEQANGLASQDYNNYMNSMLGLYGMGYGGSGEMTKLGYQASNELANNLARSLMNQGRLSYVGTANQNAINSGIIESIAPFFALL